MAKRLLIFLATLALVVLAFYVYSMNKEAMKSDNKAAYSTIAIVWKDALIDEDNTAQNYNINVIYPQFNALNNKTSQENINADIKGMMDNEVVNFKKQLSSGGLLPTQMKGIKSSLVITNEVVRADNIVSVQFRVMEAITGMAHPNNFNLIYNYDVAAGQTLGIGDIFKLDANYVQKLSDIAEAEIIKQKDIAENPNAGDFVSEGAGPKTENFQLFTLSSDTLTLIFNPATVAPDYIGTVDVAIPYTDIADILNPQIRLQ